MALKIAKKAAVNNIKRKVTKKPTAKENRQGHFWACILKPCGQTKIDFKTARLHFVTIDVATKELLLAKLKRNVAKQIG